MSRDLTAQGFGTTPLSVSHAFHSALMDPMLDELERSASRVTVSRPAIAMVSNLTGRIMQTGEDCDAAYWRQHARQPVRFADGIAALAADGYKVFLEVGPAATLCGLGRQTVKDADARWIPSLRQGRSGWEQISAAVAGLYEAGAQIDWDGFDRMSAPEGHAPDLRISARALLAGRPCDVEATVDAHRGFGGHGRALRVAG